MKLCHSVTNPDLSVNSWLNDWTSFCVYRGVITVCNDNFVISTLMWETRNESVQAVPEVYDNMNLMHNKICFSYSFVKRDTTGINNTSEKCEIFAKESKAIV